MVDRDAGVQLAEALIDLRSKDRAAFDAAISLVRRMVERKSTRRPHE